jgi:hypothetical protein
MESDGRSMESTASNMAAWTIAIYWTTRCRQAAGLMFWFTRKRLVGSYFFFSVVSRM